MLAILVPAIVVEISGHVDYVIKPSPALAAISAAFAVDASGNLSCSQEGGGDDCEDLHAVLSLALLRWIRKLVLTWRFWKRKSLKGLC